MPAKKASGSPINPLTRQHIIYIYYILNLITELFDAFPVMLENIQHFQPPFCTAEHAPNLRAVVCFNEKIRGWPAVVLEPSWAQGMLQGILVQSFLVAEPTGRLALSYYHNHYYYSTTITIIIFVIAVLSLSLSLLPSVKTASRSGERALNAVSWYRQCVALLVVLVSLMNYIIWLKCVWLSLLLTNCN